MSKSKGFIRILEAVLASVLLLTVLSFFFTVPEIKSNWANVKSEIEIRDALATVSEEGLITKAVSEYNPVILNSNLSSLLSKSLDFSIEVEGIANPIILVACGDCSPTDADRLTNILSPLQFQYKNRTIEIRVTSNGLDTFARDYEVTLIKPNVLFVYKENIDDVVFYKNTVRKFLNNGGSIILYGSLSQAQINTPFIVELLNISYYNPSSGSFYFSDKSNYDNTSYKISKYYFTISNTTTEDFNKFATSNALKDKKSVVSNGQNSAVYTNRYSNGKALWFNNFDETDKSISALLKSSIVWASERFNFDCNTVGPQQCVPKNPARSFREITLVEAGNFYSEPFAVIVKYWTVFQ